VELLKTRHVNPGQQLTPFPNNLIVLFAPESTCDLSKTKIQHLTTPLDLTDQEWLKLHRFLRLWKKTWLDAPGTRQGVSRSRSNRD
jgi:hypothetical protein